MVNLENVQRNLTGYYACEVSADAPLFHTDVKKALIIVVGTCKILLLYCFEKCDSPFSRLKLFALRFTMNAFSFINMPRQREIFQKSILLGWAGEISRALRVCFEFRLKLYIPKFVYYNDWRIFWLKSFITARLKLCTEQIITIPAVVYMETVIKQKSFEYLAKSLNLALINSEKLKTVRQGLVSVRYFTGSLYCFERVR